MKKVTYLFIIMALVGVSRARASECDCAAAHDSCGPDYVCVPECTTKSIEVTEWGVQTEQICPPRGHLCCLGFCGAAGDSASCDDSCDGTCAACENSVWPGLRPRMRKKLMRKTLVYTVPAVHFVPQAQLACPSCAKCAATDSSCTGMRIDLTQDSPGDVETADVGLPGQVRWLNVADVPVTMLLPSLAQSPNSPVVASSREAVQTAQKIHWIDGRDVEQVESLGTMTETLDTQPPAPIASEDDAAAAEALPSVLLPISIQR